MIHNMSLTNFKNFRSVELPLGRLTVLVGTNAAGKSNLRDAFRFVHGMSRGYSLAEIIGEKWIEGGSLQWKGIRGGIRETAFHGGRTFTTRILVSAPPMRLKTADGRLVPIPGFAGAHEIQVDVGTGKKSPRVTLERLVRKEVVMSVRKGASVSE